MTMEGVIPDYYTVLTMSVNTIKANVITSHYSCCINVPHRKKDKMANPF